MIPMTHTPIDRTARQVTQRGTHFDTAKKLAVAHSEDRPDTIAAATGFNDRYIGLRFGRFKVIGVAAKQNPKKNALYVVQCACGKFETRRARAITNPNNTEDRCDICQQVRFLRRNEYFEKHGTDMPDEMYQGL